MIVVFQGCCCKTVWDIVRIQNKYDTFLRHKILKMQCKTYTGCALLCYARPIQVVMFVPVKCRYCFQFKISDRQLFQHLVVYSKFLKVKEKCLLNKEYRTRNNLCIQMSSIFTVLRAKFCVFFHF